MFPPQSRRTLFKSLLAASTLFIVGCRGAPENPNSPATVPVTGMIKLDEKPLPWAVVTFIPQTAEQGLECVGTTDAEGRYRVKQIRGKEGAPVGAYTVVVSSSVDSKGQPIPPGPEVSYADLGAREALPTRYSSHSESKLTATVPATGGEIDFALKSK